MQNPEPTVETSVLTRRSFLRRGAMTAFLLPAGASGLSLILNACSPANEASTTSGAVAEVLQRTLMTPFGLSPSFSAPFVAEQEGYWRELGLSIEILPGSGTSSAMQAVLSDSADYARGGAAAVPGIINEGADLKFFFEEFRRTPYVVASLGSSPITSPEELEGATIGVVSAGGSTETQLRFLLEHAGIEHEPLTFPVTGSGASPIPIAKAGEVDAWITNVRDFDAAVAAGEDLHGFPVGDYVSFPSECWVTTTEILETRRDEVVALCAGNLQAMAFVENPENLDTVVAHNRVYSPEVTEEAVVNQLQSMIPNWNADGRDAWGEFVPEDWQELLDNFVMTGDIDSTVPLDQLFDADIPSEAKALLGW